jgi:hypothetical protein
MAKGNKKSAAKTDSSNNDNKPDTALSVVETDDSSSEDTSEEEDSAEDNDETDASKPQKKVKRTLTSTEVAQCYGKGGVAAIKSFAAQNGRKITMGPIEQTLNSMRLFVTDKGEFDTKFGELDSFLAHLKAQPGTGKGKKATYQVDGNAYPFKVQRPKTKNGRGNPMTVVPLKCFEMKSGQDTVHISFEKDKIIITPKKPK